MVGEEEGGGGRGAETDLDLLAVVVVEAEEVWLRGIEFGEQRDGPATLGHEGAHLGGGAFEERVGRGFVREG